MQVNVVLVLKQFMKALTKRICTPYKPYMYISLMRSFESFIRHNNRVIINVLLVLFHTHGKEVKEVY